MAVIASTGGPLVHGTPNAGAQPTRGAAPVGGGCPPARAGDSAAGATDPATALSLSASPDPATAGQQLTVSGRLVGVRRHGRACGITVTLWQKVAGQRRFVSVARILTASGGTYRFVFLPGIVETNREWFVTARGLRSAVVDERMYDDVSLTSTATFMVAGDLGELSGQVIPAHPGLLVTIERRDGRRWLTVAEQHLDRDSSFVLGHVFGAGDQQWRAVVAASASNLPSEAPAVSIKVAPATGIHKIRHVVIIMQENRSFDSYFGTYPGADGIPAGVCVPDPTNGGCVAPFYDSSDLNYGGPHGAGNAAADIDGGRMDGFVGQAQAGMNCTTDDPTCSPCQQNGSASNGESSQCVDVMGYHDARQIPNYWTYAENFVLQDHMFSPVASWSLPAHLYMVSEWSAYCTNPLKPSSCHSAIENPNPDYSNGINGPSNATPTYAWTDITYLLHKQDVSWAYYVDKGTEPDCENDTAMTCAPVQQNAQTPGIWNPLPDFTDVWQDNQLDNIQSLSNFFTAAHDGTLPAVSWVTPNGTVSEHPPALVSAGQTYVTGLINAIMNSPDWDSTAIFLSWDDWGGFYDNVVPPKIDGLGLGLRVPGLVISPYAKKGFIDHHILSHDSYNAFIEDDFLDGQRLNPATDGRPDPRPDVREANPILGNLTEDFDFNQPPRPPLILSVHPAPGPASTPP